ncbi:MAG: hypothetical protein LBB14_00350, partial [Puniceicoccales bacterium]|nr:hypothetical protein [Puniceicoccales bacterium]
MSISRYNAYTGMSAYLTFLPSPTGTGSTGTRTALAGRPTDHSQTSAVSTSAINIRTSNEKCYRGAVSAWVRYTYGGSSFMQKLRAWYFLWSCNTEDTTTRMVNTFRDIEEKLIKKYSDNKNGQWDGNLDAITKISSVIEKSVLSSYQPGYLGYRPHLSSFSGTPLPNFVSQEDTPRLNRLLLEIQSGRLKDDGIVVNLPLNALAIAMALGNRWGKKVCFEKLEDGNTRVYVENQTETASS